MKKIEIKVVSERGHDIKQFTATEQALEFIKTEVNERGKWCYIDGKFYGSDVLTPEDIENAQDITLTNALIGG